MIYVGNLVNTHGIKGEVKIKSNIKHKELVFKKNNQLYIDQEVLTINSYRVHKLYDMITFKEINDINDVLKYKGKKVYIDKKELNSDVLFDDDYIGLEVYSDRFIGTIFEIMNNGSQDLFVIKNNSKTYFIPNVSEFVKSIDLENKKIYINEIKGLIDEN